VEEERREKDVKVEEPRIGKKKRMEEIGGKTKGREEDRKVEELREGKGSITEGRRGIRVKMEEGRGR